MRAFRIRLLPALLHRANSYPHWIDKDRFYALKQRILTQHGMPDGFDRQYFPGKTCWSCDGTGTFWHYSGTPDVCWKCEGTGWYRWPKWVQLPRWRYGWFVFHSVGQVTHRKEAADEWGIPVHRFDGFVEHSDYTYRQLHVAHVLLGLLCDRSYFAAGLRLLWHRTWLHRFLTHRCMRCRRRLYPIRRRPLKWRCRLCTQIDQRVNDRIGDEVPF